MFDGHLLRNMVAAQPLVAADLYRYLAHLLADRFLATSCSANNVAVRGQG